MLHEPIAARINGIKCLHMDWKILLGTFLVIYSLYSSGWYSIAASLALAIKSMNSSSRFEIQYSNIDAVKYQAPNTSSPFFEISRDFMVNKNTAIDIDSINIVSIFIFLRPLLSQFIR